MSPKSIYSSNGHVLGQLGLRLVRQLGHVRVPLHPHFLSASGPVGVGTNLFLVECKLHNLTLLKNIFINRSLSKHILDMYFLNDVRHVDVLIKLRGVKDFTTLSYTSKRVEI
jgi:hypothetical protein